MPINDDYMCPILNGKYAVTKTGKVFSNYFINRNVKKLRKEPLEMSQALQTNGYKTVSLSCNGKSKSYLVHRLVATAFLFKDDEKFIVGHKDGNRSNNEIDNLKWCSYKENEKDKIGHGTVLIGQKNPFSKLSNKEAQYILDSDKPNKKIASELGVCRETIVKIKAGINWKHLKKSKS